MAKIYLEIEKHEVLGTWTTYKNDIMLEGTKIGEAYTMVDSENEDDVYLQDIFIKEEYRNKGYGTQAIKAIADMHWSIYFAPTDENNKRLYERIAEEIEVDAPQVDQGFGVYRI